MIFLRMYDRWTEWRGYRRFRRSVLRAKRQGRSS